MSEIIRIPCGSVNAFLVKEMYSSILVDTGVAGYENKIYNICRDSNVKCIILTHGHIDHIQNTAVLSKLLNVPVAIGANDKELIFDNTLQDMNGRGICGKILCWISKKSMKSSSIQMFEPDILLKDGDSLEQFGINGKIISLPGHTKGSIGLDIEDRNFIAGDALMNMFNPTISLLYEDEEQLKDSAIKISNLGERIIHFGHGKSVKNRKWI